MPVQLLQRLIAFRRRVRTRLFAFGLCTAVSGAVFAFLALVVLDRLLDLPPVPRLVAAVLFALGAVVALLHWVVRPLWRPITLGQIAGTLEEYFWPLDDGAGAKLDDRLSSTVEFLQGNQAGSDEMRRLVVANTDRIVQNIRFRDALSLRPLFIRGAALTVAVLLLLVTVLASPGFARMGLQRYLTPFSAPRWPRDVQIVPLSADSRVAVGESMTLRMKVIRGLTPTLRGVVHLRTPDGQVTTQAMQRREHNQYVCTVSPITEDLTCWFEAGDDNTRHRPLEIRVVQRPVVVQALASIDPPPYAPAAPPLVVDLQAGDISAAAGSTITASVRASKPIARDSSGQPRASLEFDSGLRVPLHRSDDRRPQWLEGTFQLLESTEFRVRLTDTDGFENPGGRPYRLAAQPDETPTVILHEPSGLAEATPTGSVALSVQAEDDFGITDLDILGRTIDSQTPISQPVTDRMSVHTEGERVLALAEYIWNLAPLGLEPGDGLIYQIQATDNFTLGEAGPHTGRSPQQRIKIISPDEFQDRLRNQFTLLQDRIRQAMLDQQAIRDQTDASATTADTDRPPAAARLDAVADLASRQARLAGRIRSLSRLFERIGRRLKLNRIDQANLERQVTTLTERLRETAAGPASAASRRLRDAADSAAAHRRDLLLEAADAQQQTLDALATMIRFMDQWGEFQEALAKTRSLLDRQQNERRRTGELARQTLGQRPESLSPRHQVELRQARRRQLQLAKETEQLIERLTSLAERLKAKDPAGAAALDEASRAGIAGDVDQHMRQAGEAIEDNRMAAAAIEQRAAEAGLADVLAGLQERRKRELAELTKRIEDARRAVAELLRQQRELLEANIEAARLAAGNEVFTKQAAGQRTLGRNTLSLANDLDSRDRTAGPAGLVRGAAGSMQLAESALKQADSPTARDHQSEAVELLAQALDELDELVREAADQAWKESLAALKDRLDGIRNRQRDINDRSAEIIARDAQAKRLTRKQYRNVARLAKSQGQLHPEVEAVRRRLGDAEVYTWVIERVLELISQSQRSLEQRRLDNALADVQQQIVDELDVLIGALDQAARLPPLDEYADGQSAGGGGAAAATQSPVPNVAELLVLKSMQLDLNAKTTRQAADFDADTASEQQLGDLQRLAARQQKIRELTEAVTTRARKVHP